ncbi:MAG: MBL fold metallo-hydrolase [Nitrospira sp.]|nr:MBL fold metallo-hydrolase [Nitrospira sp.]
MGLELIETVSAGFFQTNVYILGDKITKDAVIIDPGHDAELILSLLMKNGLNLKYILITHGHIDHVRTLKKLKDASGAGVVMHKEDMFLYENLQRQASLFFMDTPAVTDIDILLDENECEVMLGDIKCTVIHTPGHSPGSVSYYIPDMLFTGDTLFRDGIGRTDLWGGSYEQIGDSIRGLLLNLDDAIKVYPGHGPETTIGREKRENPFIKEMWYGA